MATDSTTMNWTKELGKEKVEEILDFLGGDGHTIYAIAQLVELGVPPTVLKDVAERHTTEKRNPKSQLFDMNGAPINALEGVHGLALMKKIAADLGIFSSKMGRGWQMRDLQNQVRDAVNKW